MAKKKSKAVNGEATPAFKEMRLPEAVLDSVLVKLLVLEQRVLVGHELDDAVSQIFVYARESRSSLDATRHYQMIKRIVMQAVATVEGHCKDLAVEAELHKACVVARRAEYNKLLKEHRKLKVDCADLASRNVGLREQLTTARSMIQSTQLKVDELKRQYEPKPKAKIKTGEDKPEDATGVEARQLEGEAVEALTPEVVADKLKAGLAATKGKVTQVTDAAMPSTALPLAGGKRKRRRGKGKKS